jgi:hypothetical protein
MLILVVGVPAGLLLVAGTSGTILLSLFAALCAAPVFALHYVMWGRTYSRRLRAEAKQSHLANGGMDRRW